MRFRPTLLASAIAAAAASTAVSLSVRPGGLRADASPEGAVQSGASIPAEERWRRANDAWNDGHYPEALGDLRVLLQPATAAAYLERVALLTGELFVTTELTPDGRNPRISPNGQYVAYETGPAAATVTRIVRVEGSAPRVVAELGGVGHAFDPSSTRLVYLRAADTPEWRAAREALTTADTPAARQTAQALVDYLIAGGELVVRDLASGGERVVATTAGLLKTSPAFTGNGRGVLFIGSEEADLTRSDVYIAGEAGAPVRLTDEPGHKAGLLIDPTGAALVYVPSNVAPFRAPGTPAGGGRGAGAPAGRGAGRAGGGGAAGAGAPVAAPAGPAAGAAGPNPCGGGGRGGGAPTFAVVDLAARSTRLVTGSSVTMSADGRTIAWLQRDGAQCAVQVAATLESAPRTVHSGSRIDAPALSPNGAMVAFQTMTGPGSATDWDIHVAATTGEGGARRLTRDIQHDVLPRFLTNDRLLGLMGEARHRRSHLYDVATGARTRLFANNTIRTISPEYIWVPSADGSRLLIQADRDGDTVSTERGLAVVDLTRRITVTDLLARLDRQLAAETDLRRRMTRAYEPIDALVRRTVATISRHRVYDCHKTHFDFDSKHVTRPGNAKAIASLEASYASFGYTPVLQWFQPGTGNRTANVLATLRGTEHPDLIYVVSSHFDSVAGGPGADDDTSGTCALLETARALAGTPLPATIVFASFTGEESGLLGSREFVRLAAEQKWNVVGALNNDMIGWAADSARLDNTIRYSNAGIKDIQHGAAFLYTDLVLYDAKYYRSTDAQAFYDAWGDIVGGIGSYPVLANPNYHQPTDLLETISFRQVAETAKVTAATLVYLASSPSRLKDLRAVRRGSDVDVTWTPSPETGVTGYIVSYGAAATPSARTRRTVTTPSITLRSLPAGTEVAVKAVNARGLEGWDWARVVIQ